MPLGHELAMQLRTAYWALHRRTDARLQPLGVTANQFVLLSLVDEHDGLTQRKLAELAASDANTVGAMVAVLQKNGLLVRRRCPDDGRAWRLSLTDAGRLAYRQAWRRGEAVRSRVLAAMRPGEAHTLLRLLQRVADALEETPGEAPVDRELTNDSPENSPSIS